MRSFFIICFFLLFFAVSANASLNNDSLLVGTWKGTSICQVRPSACNDEIAVYHITKTAKPNIYHMVLNKLVNGKEEDMGENDFIFDPADNSLFCYMEKYKVTIKFTVKGKDMDGTLHSGNTLYRIIKLKKEN